MLHPLRALHSIECARYRSGITQELDGHARTSGLTGFAALGNGTVDAKAKLHLPEIAMLGAAYDVTPELTLLGQLNWYGWHDFDTLRVELADGRRLESPQDFDNTFGGALGAEYRWSERLTLRAGTQLDATPVSDDLRSTQQPDGNRLWAAAGLTYALRPGVSVDVSYAHAWVRSADIDRSDEFAPLVSSARTRASVDAHANVVGVQLNYRF